MNNKNGWWGRSTSIDLHGCDHSLITKPAEIQKFVDVLIKKLKMKKVGPTLIKRFGHAQLRGYSVMQFIETSTITIHFDEFGNRAFIDVFSCKKYNPKLITAFCKNYLHADKVISYIEERR